MFSLASGGGVLGGWGWGGGGGGGWGGGGGGVCGGGGSGTTTGDEACCCFDFKSADCVLNNANVKTSCVAESCVCMKSALWVSSH